jgi:beta-lactamase regulating signal transducer with metallopeptidase domain
MSFFSAIHGYWLWYVWAFIAVVVVIGYVRVRHKINRAEAAGDPADEAARLRHAAEHEKRKHKGIE